MLTIGITSFNRGKYLASLLRGLKDEALRDRHQVILVDNFSSEQAITSILKDPENSWIDVVERTGERSWVNDEYHAKNIIIDRAKGDVILFLQDDLQYIGYEGSLRSYAAALQTSPYQCLTANAVRRSTVNHLFSKNSNQYSMKGHIFWAYPDDHFHTMGFFKKSVFDVIGKYPTTWPATQEYWGRSEDWYDAKVKSKFKNVSAFHHVPIFAPVWNDSRGGYAFIRGNTRYGEYLSAPEQLYYQQMSYEDWKKHTLFPIPATFVDVANPLGWKLKLDENGDVMKYSQELMMSEGPFETI